MNELLVKKYFTKFYKLKNLVKEYIFLDFMIFNSMLCQLIDNQNIN
jgi:hypothetical protein